MNASRLRLILHDWTKLLPWHAKAYGNQFCGPKNSPAAFAKAWLYHQNRFDHHWEFWIPRTHQRGVPPYGAGIPIDMPDAAVREMIADWLGASKAYDGKWPQKGDWPWLEQNFEGLNISENTRSKVENILLDMKLIEVSINKH